MNTQRFPINYSPDDYADLERQIAELRDHCNALEVEHRQAIEEMQSALAENARLRALPLKDDIERGEDWRDDPSADERWNAGLDYGQTQLCNVLGVDPATVDWDAATETLYGDVQAVIGKILAAAFGEDWPALLSRLRAGEQEENAWRSMDSAPKDGKHVLLCVKSNEFFYAVEGAYCRSEGWLAAFCEKPVEPVYWAPKPTGFAFPAAPSEHGGERG